MYDFEISILKINPFLNLFFLLFIKHSFLTIRVGAIMIHTKTIFSKRWYKLSVSVQTTAFKIYDYVLLAYTTLQCILGELADINF